MESVPKTLVEQSEYIQITLFSSKGKESDRTKTPRPASSILLYFTINLLKFFCKCLLQQTGKEVRFSD